MYPLKPCKLKSIYDSFEALDITPPEPLYFPFFNAYYTPDGLMFFADPNEIDYFAAPH